MTKINIATENHTIQSIEDQIYFLSQLFASEGINVSINKRIKLDYFNIFIEGELSREWLKDLEKLRIAKAEFAVVLTEHLRIDQKGSVSLNGKNSNSGPTARLDPFLDVSRRISSLILLSQLRAMFLTCGDLPQLQPYKKFFPNCNFFQLPWPKFERQIKNFQHVGTNLFFSTPHSNLLSTYRKQIINEIENQGYRVNTESSGSMKRWLNSATKSAAILDIPKNRLWKWDSPMRTFRSIVAGRSLISARQSQVRSNLSIHFDIPLSEFLSSEETEFVSAKSIWDKYESFRERQNKFQFEHLLEYIRHYKPVRLSFNNLISQHGVTNNRILNKFLSIEVSSFILFVLYVIIINPFKHMLNKRVNS
jgi:hypothetical protein